MTKTENEIIHFTQLKHIWWGARTPAGQKRYDNKLRLFQKITHVHNASSILEVGCGDGEFTKRLVKILPNRCKLYATDITPAVIQRGKKVLKHKQLTFSVDNLEHMKFARGSFNIVCGISILHHVQVSKALKDIYRVLKKGGEIFFTEPNALNPQIFIGHRIPNLRTKWEYSPDEIAFIRWVIEKELIRIGFRNVLVKNIDFLHPSIPKKLIPIAESISSLAESIPLLKEISGSLLIYATK